MLQRVNVGPQSLQAYASVAGQRLVAGLRERAMPLRGLRVLQLNATAYGGGVAELLRSLVPLERDLGLDVDWCVMSADDQFFGVTKAMHNGLQGEQRLLAQHEIDAYQKTSARNAQLVDEDYDVIIVHDPQPLAIRHFRGPSGARWIWRSHIDTSSPCPEVWGFLGPFVAEYDAAVFTMEEFIPPAFPLREVRIIPPAIDPLSPKNMELPDASCRAILSWIGIDPDRPLVVQVSRFDPWKDPLGVIAAYRLVREQVPDLQLAMVGSMALDDPQGWEIYREVVAASETDPPIHVFTNLTGVGNLEVNAFQRQAKVVMQKSLREGFGLVVSEALWKGTPVVAGRTGGLPLQMPDGVGGYLVESVEEAADRILHLLRRPEEARTLAERGREHVRRNFLLPRLLADEIELISWLR